MTHLDCEFPDFSIDNSRVQCETTEAGLRGNQLLFATAAKMWSHGGIFAYYRGLTLGLLGIVPYSAIDLGCFEGMKRAYKVARMKSRNCSYEEADPGISFNLSLLKLGNIAILCMGALSGSIGASVVFPINLLVSSAISPC